MTTTADFIQRAVAKHGDAYDYTGTVFSGWKSPVTFRCPEHGEVERIAWNHTKPQNFGGCPVCAKSRIGKPPSRAAREGITQSVVREVFDYDPETGIFTRRGGEGDASSAHNAGYRTLSLAHKNLLAHRLAFLWMTGAIPEFVDHVNGDRSDNRWCNLRAATSQINNQNIRAARSRNKSGVLGVYAYGTRWRARIVLNGITTHLGTYDTQGEAYAAYVAAKRVLHKGNTL